MGFSYRKEIRTLTGHSRMVWSVTVTPDGKQVISGSGDNTLKIWDLATGKNYTPSQVIVTRLRQYVSHPMVKQVISGSWDNTLKIWDLGKGITHLNRS
jgi:WD40 repeat protein